MAENQLGKIKMQMEEEGAEEAGQTMADSFEEGGSDTGGMGGTGGGGQGGGGGTIGDMLGGISGKLIAILGVLGFLASLKPIQELLGGIQRLFSVAILPLVSLLMTLLRPVMQKILRFVAGLDFDNLLQSLITNLSDVLNTTVDRLVQKVNDSLSFDPGTGFSNFLFDVGQPAKAKQAVRSGDSRRGPFGTVVDRGSIGEDIMINLGWLNEQSNTTLDQNVAETSSETSLNAGPGGQ